MRTPPLSVTEKAFVSYLPLWRPGRPPCFDTEMAERVCSVYHARCYAIGGKGGLRRFHGEVSGEFESQEGQVPRGASPQG